jgi:hypothetical protein
MSQSGVANRGVVEDEPFQVRQTFQVVQSHGGDFAPAEAEDAESKKRWEKVEPWLQIDRTASTFAERAAELRALGKLAPATQRQQVAAALDGLPLDAPHLVQEAAGRALGTINPAAAAQYLLARLAAKYNTGLGITVELGLIGDLPPAVATPALLDAA